MQDTGYSWVVLFAAFMLNMHQVAGIATAGVFLLAFMDEFDSSKAEVTPIFGILGCFGLFGFPIGCLCHSYGCRPVALVCSICMQLSLITSAWATHLPMLYLTYGLMGSIGGCCFNMAGTITLQTYFERRRALANGISMGGMSLGYFVWPLLAQCAVDMYGWRGALLIVAGIHLHSLVFVLLLRPNTTTTQPVATGTDTAVHTQGGCERAREQLGVAGKLIKTKPVFVTYLVGLLFTFGGHSIPITLLPARARAMGIDPYLGILLISIIGVTSGMVRPLAGWMGDFACIDKILVGGVSAILSGLLSALSVLFTTYTHMVTYAVSYAVFTACYIVLQGPIVVAEVGMENTASGYGMLMTTLGLGYLASLTISGKLMDMMPDPKYAFVVFGGVQCLGGLIMVCPAVFTKAPWARSKLVATGQTKRHTTDDTDTGAHQ